MTTIPEYGRLEKLAQFLDQLPNYKFDFSTVVSSSAGGCGTVCCAIGWLPAVFPDLVRWAPFDERSKHCDVFTIRGIGVADSHFDTAERVLGVTGIESSWLFTPGSNYEEPPPWGQPLRSTALPKEVAAAIRTFCTWRKAQPTI
jgi:hypothetical protein